MPFTSIMHTKGPATRQRLPAKGSIEHQCAHHPLRDSTTAPPIPISPGHVAAAHASPQLDCPHSQLTSLPYQPWCRGASPGRASRTIASNLRTPLAPLMSMPAAPSAGSIALLQRRILVK